MKELNTKETIKKTKEPKTKQVKEKKAKIEVNVTEPEIKKDALIDNEIIGDKIPDNEIDKVENKIEEIEGVNYKGIVAKGEFFVINGERFREALDAAKYNFKINGDK